MTKKRIINYRQGMVLLVLALFVFGCHPGVKKESMPQLPLTKLAPDAYPVFLDHMAYQGLVDAMDQSLLYFKRVPAERTFGYATETYSAAHLIRSLETFKAFVLSNPSVDAVNAFIKERFTVYAARGNADGAVLFTGYFEPTYAGSREKSDAYPYPVYTIPNDLFQVDLSQFSDQYKNHKRLMARVDTAGKRVVPYYSRQEINAARDFHERAEPLVWLNNRVDRFFLEIQGSGRIDLGNSELLRVHYALSNGKAYRSVGRYLMDKNEIQKENMSMQAIRAWLEQHPERVDEVLNYNESFVFFQEETDGPYGSIGVKVHAFRSLATDSSLFPRGALCFMQARLPDKAVHNPLSDWEKASFFVMNQDTGGAIKGVARADLFCGNGAYAAFTAGHMNVPGQLYFLVLKPSQP